MIDVLVIGAGPAGTTTARLCAEAGLRVRVLEEHGEVGRPVHCTGIVGGELFRDFGIPSHLVLRELRRFRVHSPCGDHFDLPARDQAMAYVLDRHALDVHLGSRAREAGVAFDLGTRAREIRQDRTGVVVRAEHDGETVDLRAEVCVLACGAMSSLPSRSGIVPPRTFYRTIQANFRIPDLEGAEIYLGRHVAPGSFGYAVEVAPGAAKVGIITKGPAHQGYRRLLEGLAGRIHAPLGAEGYRRIPMGASRRSVVGRVCAVGDAAGQAKTTTGGGIYYAMLCSRMLAQAIVAARPESGNLDPDPLCRYDRAWRSRLGREIQAGLWLRRFFEHVGDPDVDRLVRLAASPSVQQLLAREWDFDFHGSLLAALARSPELQLQALRTASGALRARRLLDAVVGTVGGTFRRHLLGAGEVETA